MEISLLAMCVLLSLYRIRWTVKSKTFRRCIIIHFSRGLSGSLKRIANMDFSASADFLARRNLEFQIIIIGPAALSHASQTNFLLAADFGFFSRWVCVRYVLLLLLKVVDSAPFFPIIFDVTIKTNFRFVPSLRYVCVCSVRTWYFRRVQRCFHIKCGFPRQRTTAVAVAAAAAAADAVSLFSLFLRLFRFLFQQKLLHTDARASRRCRHKLNFRLAFGLSDDVCLWHYPIPNIFMFCSCKLRDYDTLFPRREYVSIRRMPSSDISIFHSVVRSYVVQYGFGLFLSCLYACCCCWWVRCVFNSPDNCKLYWAIGVRITNRSCVFSFTCTHFCTTIQYRCLLIFIFGFVLPRLRYALRICRMCVCV